MNDVINYLKNTNDILKERDVFLNEIKTTKIENLNYEGKIKYMFYKMVLRDRINHNKTYIPLYIDSNDDIINLLISVFKENEENIKISQKNKNQLKESFNSYEELSTFISKLNTKIIYINDIYKTINKKCVLLYSIKK